jgi:glycosyltransferase involved in cell wall biosynthesis
MNNLLLRANERLAECRLTIAVLTFNEELRIEQCLRSAAFADQILVVDSGSTDRTVEIARLLGAEVHAFPDWHGFAVQRNRLLQHARGDYVFFLDADEVIDDGLRGEIETAVAGGRDAIWEIRWCEVAFGRKLTHMRSTGGVKRMFKRKSLKQFNGIVHEAPEMAHDGLPVLQFDSRLLHYSRTSVYGCLRKLAQYVQLGAAKRAKAGKRGGVLRGLGSGLAIFTRQYLLGRGFLYGAEGFLFCLFISLECFFRYVAVRYDARHFDERTSR